jgi:hypothetical protein
MGALEEVTRDAEGHGVASGWAILPMSDRIADSVILAYEKGDGDPIIFARANVGKLRDDIAAEIGDSSYRQCGWELAWKPGTVPKDATLITAWAFNAETCLAYPLGSFRL